MLNSVFETVFQVSVRASLIILAIFILKKLFRHKVNIKWHVVIWAVVLVKLALPWAPQSHLSLFNAVKSVERAARQVFQEERDFHADLRERSEILRIGTYNNTTEKSEELQTVGGTDYQETSSSSSDRRTVPVSGRRTVPVSGVSGDRRTVPVSASVVWLAGCVMFMLVFQSTNLILHIRIKRGVLLDSGRIRDIVAGCRSIAGVHREIHIKEAEGITSPLLYGIRRPIIVLPRGMAGEMTENELRHVILHELMHCRKRDNAVWVVAFIIRAIHWFNPLVHLAAVEYRNSNEKYCDSMVLECLGEEESRGYGKTLVRLARGYRRGIVGLASAIHGRAGALKERIMNIARFRQGTCRWSITAVVILALAACSGISNEVDEPDFIFCPEPVELHIYTRGIGIGGASRPNNVDDIENMFLEVGMKLSDSINVTPVFHWKGNEEYTDEIEKLVKSGERVDAFTSFGGYEFYDRDVITDLSNLFPEYAPGYYNELMSHSVGLQKLKSCTVEDMLLCVPGNDVDTNRAFILARKDLLEQFAPDGFETLEDYGEFMAQVKEQYPMVIPGYVDAMTFFKTYIQGNGYFRYQASFLYKSLDPRRWDEYYPMERLDEFSTAYYILKDWYDKEYVQEIRDPELWLGMGGLGSVLMSGLDVDRYTAGGTSEHEFVAFPLYMESPYEADVNTMGLSVSNSCDCPERVMMFLEWIHSSQEAYDLFSYGVENRNYVLKGDRIAFYSDEHDIQPINSWCSESYFADFRYDRLQEYHQDGFKDIYKRACLENVFTSQEIQEKVLGATTEKINSFYTDEAAVNEFNEEYYRIEGNIDKYVNALYREMRLINRGLLWNEPAELTEMLEETGIDEYIELINRRLKKIREE